MIRALLICMTLVFGSKQSFSQDYEVILNYPLRMVQNGEDFLLNYSRFLHERHDFDSFVIFTTNSTKSGNSRSGMSSLEQVLMEELHTPLVIWGMEREIRFREQLGEHNLIFVYVNSFTDPLLEVLSATMNGLHFSALLVIFRRDNSDSVPHNSKELKDFFEWCWIRNFINVALILQSDQDLAQIQVFYYTPFPKLQIYQLQHELFDDEMDFIVDCINNTHGYIFDTPIFMDPPTVFMTPYESHKNEKFMQFITGTIGRIFHEFSHYINATINIALNVNVSFYAYHKETLLLAAQGVIDMGIHPYSALLPYANQTEGSFPVGNTNACIIVPVIAEIDSSEYLSRSLGPIITWVLILELLCLFGVQCLHLRAFNFGSGLLYAFGALFFQSIDMRQFMQRRVVLRVLHLLVVTVSLLLECAFCASLTSLLSTTVEGDQIDTAGDLLRSGLQIMVNRFEKEVYFDRNFLPSFLGERLLVVNESFVDENKNGLNTAYAYVATAQEWKKLDFQQQLLWKPRFRIASDFQMCTANFYLRFPVQWNSPFHRSMLKYYLTVLQNGLAKVWEDRSIYHAIKLHLIYHMDADKQPGLHFEWQHLQKPFVVYNVMIMAALLCFVLELCWHRRVSKKSAGRTGRRKSGRMLMKSKKSPV